MKLPVLGILAISMPLCIAARAADRVPDCPCTTPRLLDVQELPIEVEPAALQRQYEVLLGMSLEQIEYAHLGPV